MLCIDEHDEHTDWHSDCIASMCFSMATIISPAQASASGLLEAPLTTCQCWMSNVTVKGRVHSTVWLWTPEKFNIYVHDQSHQISGHTYKPQYQKTQGVCKMIPSLNFDMASNSPYVLNKQTNLEGGSCSLTGIT